MSKNNGARIIVCIFVFISLIFFPGAEKRVFAGDENTIVIANDEWPPFLSKNMKHYGVFCHIMTETFASEGVTVKYKWAPWKRAYIRTQYGEYDATATWIPTRERKVHFFYSDTILVNKKVFFHRKSDSFDWKDIEDLKGIEIGGTNGYIYGEAFDRAVKEGKLKIQWVTRDWQNFEKLLIGRIQIFPQELDVGYAYINNLPAEKAEMITHHPKSIIETTHHLIFSKKIKKNKRLLRLFDNGLRRLKENGKLDEYFEASRRGDYNKK